ncbi:MAG: PKD domain-containing protein, partial [Anaerolineae bacterium]|nr:PKD domain-containing protein [Anaerolineae bacterium]
DGTPAGGAVTWNFTSIASYGGTATGWFSGTLPCTTGSVTNDEYRVVSSDEGVDSPPGAAVVFDVVAPAVDTAFDVSTDTVVVSTTIHFTGTSTTNGTPIVEREWDFGDGSAHVFTPDASHTYLSDDIFTARLTVTDTCGYSEEAVTSVTITAPTIVADFNHEPSPANIISGSSVIFTDTSTTDGPAIIAWAWDFGDGGTSGEQHPTHTYDTVGTFDVTLTVTDTLSYSDSVAKQDLINVASGCEPLTAGHIAGWSPLSPVILDTVTFTATITPVGATQPLTYTWNFGDGDDATVTSATVQHAYTSAGEITVSLLVYNPCTPSGVSEEIEIIVVPHMIYLPLVIKGTP